MKTTENKLIGKYRGNIDGARIYRVARGHWQIQNPARPNLSSFDGTLRDCEKALHARFINMVRPLLPVQ